MDVGIRKRIDKMFGRDRAMAWIFLVLLWVSTSYVYWAVCANLMDTKVKIALTIGAFAVLIFNTASILAMIKHYKEDKGHIYGLDIRHLDENRARRDELKESALEVSRT